MLEAFVFLVFVVVFIGFVGLGLYWLYRSFANFVDGNEMVIRVVFGKPDDKVYVAGDGRIFVPRLPGLFKCYLKRYPMCMFDLDYDTIEVMSKAGDFEGEHYGSVELFVDSRAYLNFPREREMLVNKDLPDESVGFLGELSVQERKNLEAKGEIAWRGVTAVLEKTHPLIKIF